ncbi:MAG: helix-turn-helix domain-containing protein [Nitrospiraceae bacterium]|nr:helix-turn-helix domain-containing protein [Nitrospiraceae bacterium]
MSANKIIKKYINPYNLFVGSFIPNWLLKRTEISPGAKLCYARLAQFAGKDGECFPGQSTLASEIGTGERQVRRYLSELEESELIETVQAGLHQTNHYRFLWHPWMEGKDKKKNPSGKGGSRGCENPDRTYMTAPDRTDMSGQERTNKSVKKNQLKESSKETTTATVVVDGEEIQKLRKALAPAYADIPDNVLTHLINKKGIENVLSVARQTAYQLSHGSKSPDNPTGHFISLATRGMNRPQGYVSAEERRDQEETARMRSALRLKEQERERENLIPLADIQDFLNNFGERT